MEARAEPTPTTDMPAYPSMGTLASKALAESAGDYDAATALLAEWLDDDGGLKDNALQVAARSLVHKAAHTKRRTVATSYTSAPSSGSNKSGIKAMARRNWYDWLLPGGKRLGDATRDDLRVAAQFWYEQAEANRRNGQFMDRLAQLVSDKGTVAASLTQDQIEEVATDV